MPDNYQLFNVPKQLISRYCDEENTLPEYRTEFMRDRDRLMYATAFRRLAGKTQIYTVGTDDHKKNRLTHTLEVAQIARTISIALDLDPNLAEAIALAHDFGHTPFGHAGEEMLHQIMIPNAKIVKNSPFYETDLSTIKKRIARETPDHANAVDSLFGFKHNLQSVRVCAMLEDSYRGKNNENIGLNLTNFTLYGMMIHSSLHYRQTENFKPNFQKFFDDQMKLKGSNTYAWSFESYIVKLADDFAQWHHDLEDAMREGVLPIDRICNTILDSLNNCLSQQDKEILQKIKGPTRKDRHYIAQLSHIVVNTLVCDLVETTKKNFKDLSIILEEKGITTPEQFFSKYDDLELPIKKEDVVTVSTKINTEAFKGIIRESIHHSRNVERMNEKGKYIIRKLFEAYYAHPQQLPDGPILHWLVETHPETFRNIDEFKTAGIGEARIAFSEHMKNPSIYEQGMLMRRICDHIASMTDHYAIEEYNNLYG